MTDNPQFYFLQKKCIIPKSIHQRLLQPVNTISSIAINQMPTPIFPIKPTPSQSNPPQEAEVFQNGQNNLIRISDFKKQLKEEILEMENKIREKVIEDFHYHRSYKWKHDQLAQSYSQESNSPSYIR